MSLLDQFPHTVTHKRYEYEQDEYGGNLQEETTVTSGVRAWVQNASMAEIQEYEKQDQKITHKVFIITDPGLRPGDVLVVTSGPSFVGKTLHHKVATDRSAGLGKFIASMCEESNNLQTTWSGSYAS